MLPCSGCCKIRITGQRLCLVAGCRCEPRKRLSELQVGCWLLSAYSQEKLMKWAAIVLVSLCSALVSAQSSISTGEAKNHVGENATVCGDVASTRYVRRRRGSPTFLNLDKPYPRQVFTVVIWGSDRSKFGVPEETLDGRHICVTGPIMLHRGVAETVAHAPSQIKVQ